MTMDKLLQSKEKMRKINQPIEKTKELSLRKIKNQETPKRKSFEEKHKRLTTYVERDLYKLIKKLKGAGHIRTTTEFVNAAFKEYIKNHIKT